MAKITENKNTAKERLVPMKNVPFDEDETQKIFQRPDGTLVRWITKEGHETLQEWDSMGNYRESRADGSRIHFHANNYTEYTKGSVTISIDNNNDVKIHGHSRINVDQDAQITVGKHASVVVGDMADVYAGGHIKLAATDIALQSTAGSIVFNSARDIELRADKGRITHHSSGVQTFTTEKGDFHVNAGGKVQTLSGMNTEITSLAKIETYSQSDTDIVSDTKVDAKIDDANGVRIVRGNVTVTKVSWIGQDDLKDKSGDAVPKHHSP